MKKKESFSIPAVGLSSLLVIFLACALLMLLLFIRLVYLMIWRSDYYGAKATDLHERERSIKAARGQIVDCRGVVIADNKTVCTVSVIHNQIEDKEEVISVLRKELDLTEEYVRDRIILEIKIIWRYSLWVKHL